jgi:SRSO17 transposase
MRPSETARAQRFATYVDQLAAVLGHQDRQAPLRAYVTGLCLPGDRKSIEPMAARVDPRHVRSRHQSMHHCIADAPWDAAAVLRVAREWVLAPMVRHGPVAAWIVDDTGFPKKGQHSVGVARQYCGVLGKQDNCQVAVSVSVANEAVSLPVAYQLYLPESWARDPRRRRAVGVPPAVAFQPKWQMALDQIRTLQTEGVPSAPVVADAGYGDTTAFRDALTNAGVPYVVGVKQDRRRRRGRRARHRDPRNAGRAAAGRPRACGAPRRTPPRGSRRWPPPCRRRRGGR